MAIKGDLSRSPIAIPESFWHVAYNADHYPGAPGMMGVDGGANCQQYAYSILRHFGFSIPDFRSSDLWADQTFTRVSPVMVPLGLILVHSKPTSFGAHVGLCLGGGLILHLSRSIGVPAIETLEELRNRHEYRYLIGIKVLFDRRQGT
ncbi:hypothetical protein N2601_25300 (plasmid) [Rhizobium sp. CB3060]|uniref:hypothetical protein n=1 Tax=Rhizobium sp. CB3060 TaxID=3138255 RepID=UPI0021A5BE0C|nr:hypothetical protein [Rhizobium tropici]UWU23575.1 hypothetical protein N2601_25300 [Rhizobium tropici]